MSQDKVQSVRVRGRNVQDVVTQLVDSYNSSEGWAVKKVVNSFNNLEVYLERNAKQAVDKNSSTSNTPKAEVKDVKAETSESPEKVKTTISEKSANTKAKKTAATTSNNEVKEVKKV